ncbi:MAG: hypothetical protein ACKOAL_09485, partial [Chthoniobacterales bacterium]
MSRSSARARNQPASGPSRRTARVLRTSPRPRLPPAVKIRTHHYTLQPGPDPARAARGPRKGTLIRVEFGDETTGYADLHPWEEF